MRGSEEIWRAALIHHYESRITNVNIHAVIGADAVDCLYLCAMRLFVAHLIVGTATKYLAFEFRSFKGSAQNRDDGALSMWSPAHLKRLVYFNTQFHYEL